jgi:hypothetical protein
VRERAHFADEADPVQAGHVQIGDDQVHFLLQNFFQRIFPVHRMNHAVAGLGQSKPYHLAGTGGIVHAHDGS